MATLVPASKAKEEMAMPECPVTRLPALEFSSARLETKGASGIGIDLGNTHSTSSFAACERANISKATTLVEGQAWESLVMHLSSSARAVVLTASNKAGRELSARLA